MPEENDRDRLDRGEHKKCPYCCEIILADARKCKHCGEFFDRPPSHVNATPRIESVPEESLWTGHPSAVYYLGAYVFGALLLVLGIGLILILWAIVDRKSKVYTITTRKVMSKEGILSRRTTQVAIKDIRVLNMKQDFGERIWGLGTVEIGSAGTAGIEVTFKGIKNPVVIRDRIAALKDAMA